MTGPTPIAIAIVLADDRVLVGRRAAGELAGCDEFPGGKVEPGEAPEDAAVRECREETGLMVRLQGLLLRECYRYREAWVDLHFFLAVPDPPGQEPREPFRWVRRGQLGQLRFPPANRSALQRLAELPVGGPHCGPSCGPDRA